MLNLKELRKEWKRKGFTDQDMADLLGIENVNSFVRKFRGENGYSKEISATQAVLICEAIGTTVEMFLKR